MKTGDKISAQPISVIGPKEQGTVGADNFFAAKKVGVFTVPGAFTPTCSKALMPVYLAVYDAKSTPVLL